MAEQQSEEERRRSSQAQQQAEQENRKRGLEEGQALRAQSMAEFTERTKGKPTPTQEENDRAKLGEHVTEKEPDGSDLDEGQASFESRQRHLQAKPAGGGYQTRQAAPAQQQQPRPASGSPPARNPAT